MDTSGERTFGVLGSNGTGKSTLMGNLLYNCGGVDLLAMERLQRAGIALYDQVLDALERDGVEPSFYTRKFRAKFVALESADCVVYLVDATSYSPSISPATINSLKRAKSVIMLVNKMDKLEWRGETYANIVNGSLGVLEGAGVDVKSMKIIPVSALYGDNLIERSAHTTWYDGWANTKEGSHVGWTLIDAIDAL